MFNITTFLDIHGINTPEKTALIHPSTNRNYSYRDLDTITAVLARNLQKRGIKKKDRIIIYLDSSPEYLISIFAAWKIGAIVVPANIVWREEELLYCIQDSGARMIIASEKDSDLVFRIRHEIPALDTIMLVGGTGDDAWETASSGDERAMSLPCHPDDVCQIQYTSGTTGQPKGAMLTQFGWMAAFDAEQDALDLTSEDIYLGIYPMAHVGISWGMSVLKAGGTWVIMERFNLDQYIHLTGQYSITILAGMPPVIHALAETPFGTENKFRTVRRIISGGGPMHSPTWKKFHERFAIPVANAYGLSETIVLGAGTVIQPGHYPTADDYNSVGTPVGYSEVRIVDETDPCRHLPDGTAGEIALRGPGVATGYWNRPDDTSAVFLPDGWFLTGDIGYIDTQGMLVITDRKKDMIIMSGWKVYPTEVENALIHHPKIRDIAIFGCPDEEKGEIPAAAVVLRETHENLTLEELTTYARNHLAGYKVPRRLVILNELPRVGGWKLLRRKLRDDLCHS